MTRKGTKYIVVLGSMMSGLGKGIVTASIGQLLKSRGYNVVPIKFDGYLNVDCGTMNPFRHGEVFVLDDGSEVDMDFGTYERFLNRSLTKISSITGGKIFKHLIEKERRGGFLGRDVQVVPHLTNELKDWVRKVGEEEKADIVLVEVGGTVGDLENNYFIEALRQMSFEENANMLFIQLTYVPSLGKGELKTKPTQHANRLIQSLGIWPRIILCRGEEKLTEDAKEKLSVFCNVPAENIIYDPMVEVIYELPEVLENEDLYNIIAERLSLDKRPAQKGTWHRMVQRMISPKKGKLKVAIVGKYTAVKDAYVSVKEALVHAGAANDVKPEISFVESTDIEKKGVEILGKFDAVVVPGGFGKRGIEGKIDAIRYCREHGIPLLGLCLGMQLMVIEWARSMCGMEGANSTEFNKDTLYPVIDILPEQKSITEKGATMRLGAYPCRLKKGTKAHAAYGKEDISERHRHRYEVNPDFVKKLEEGGLVVSGVYPKKDIVEMAEWPGSFGIATQAHPELKSRLEEPAPLFVALLKAALEKKESKKR